MRLLTTTVTQAPHQTLLRELPECDTDDASGLTLLTSRTHFPELSPLQNGLRRVVSGRVGRRTQSACCAWLTTPGVSSETTWPKLQRPQNSWLRTLRRVQGSLLSPSCQSWRWAIKFDSKCSLAFS